MQFPDGPRGRLQRRWPTLGDVPVLPTAAGHDAGILSAQVPTAMLFVRNPTGVSHSPDEHAEIADCRPGREALADVMAGLGVIAMTGDLVVRTRLARRRRRRRRPSLSPSTDGRITAVETGSRAQPDRTRLRGLVIPGLANAHSHAFHRALRGAHPTRPRHRSGPGAS